MGKYKHDKGTREMHNTVLKMLKRIKLSDGYQKL